MKPSLVRSTSPRCFGPTVVALAALAAVTASAATTTPAPTTPRIAHPSPGGINPGPVITNISTAHGFRVRGFGYGTGTYELQTRTNMTSGEWTTVKTADGVNGFELQTELGDAPISAYRVAGPSANYDGSYKCSGCHWEIDEAYAVTPHAHAYSSLESIGMGNNDRCVSCHTVGADYAGGFTTMTNTPRLAGVQCENCHGPAGDHALDVRNLAKRPVKELSAKMCGGCHTDAHHPTFDEWEHAHHNNVDAHVAEYFREAGTARELACGPCHSGSVRLAMLKTLVDTNTPIPSEERAVIEITCSVCHDPHTQTIYGSHLRNPTYSTNAFSYSTSANTTFRAQYKADIMICGQCHNGRGALPTDTSRPPHHSPQYNILTGTLGVTGTGARNSRHTRLEKQCITCHMHPKEVEEPTDDHPNYTGHRFEVQYDSCVSCHDTPENSEAITEELQVEIKQKIQDVKTLLDTWATTKAPDVLRTNYGALGWEYTSVGQISNPSGATVQGPTSAHQAQIPTAIKEARYNLYLVEHDGSFGVHNPRYANHLLQVSTDKVNALLAP